MSTANPIQMPNCPQCGAELRSGDPAGLCPNCLIQGAFDSSISPNESASRTVDAATGEAADDDFGHYHILRTLGEGGMGTVYLAEQLEPIRRHVALKVVKLGMDTAQVLVRFNNERQALARMRSGGAAARPLHAPDPINAAFAKALDKLCGGFPARWLEPPPHATLS